MRWNSLLSVNSPLATDNLTVFDQIGHSISSGGTDHLRPNVVTPGSICPESDLVKRARLHVEVQNKHAALHINTALCTWASISCICAGPFAYVQSRLQICKAACRFAKPRVHVHEPDFINTWCFQRSTSLKRRPEFVIARRVTRDSAVRPPLSGPGEKRTAARRSCALQTTFPQNHSLKCSVWMIWQRKKPR